MLGMTMMLLFLGNTYSKPQINPSGNLWCHGADDHDSRLLISNDNRFRNNDSQLHRGGPCSLSAALYGT